MTNAYLYLATDGVNDFKKFGIAANVNIRLINYNTQFEKPSPFKFILKNKNLSINQGEDLTISLKIEGDELPQDVYLHIEESIYKLDKKDISNFEYQLQNLQANSSFYFSAAGYNSKSYNLEIIAKPIVCAFSIDINYPDYTGRKDEAKATFQELMSIIQKSPQSFNPEDVAKIQSNAQFFS